MPGVAGRIPTLAAMPPEARLEKALDLWQSGKRADAEAAAASALGLSGRRKGSDKAKVLTTLAEKLYFAGDYIEAASAAASALKADRNVLSAG